MALLSGERVASGRAVIDADGYAIVKESGATRNGIADTLAVSTTTTSPGATTALATLTTPTPGVYAVEVTVVLTGTAETALQNLRLRSNAVAVSTIPTLSGSGAIRLCFPRVTVSAGNLDVQSIAAGVVGSIYNIALTATRLS